MWGAGIANTGLMNVLFATGSAATYMAPPVLGDRQVNCGPDWANEVGPDGRVRSLATPCGEYDLHAVAAKLLSDQRPDVVVCLVDASWRNLPRNLTQFDCPRVLLVADTHHLDSPLVGMLRYASAEPFDRIVLLYDRHHAPFFHAAGFQNLHWFPGLTFPHADHAVRAARSARRVGRIAFVGQSGRFHPRRQRLLATLGASGLPFERQALSQRAGLGFYGTSLVGFNASLNGDLNLRVFEILSTGAALLTDRLVPGSGLAHLLADGREMLTYGTQEELVEEATHAVRHVQETREIGAAGARWFDQNFSAERRRALFQALAHDGVSAPKFAFDEREKAQVFFGGDTDRLVQAALVYEGIQSLHRDQETVQVHLGADVPDDIAILCTTLPRVAVNRAALAADADLAVFSGTPVVAPVARCLWAWNAGVEEIARMQPVFAAQGFALLSEDVAMFGRVTGKPAEQAVVRARVADSRTHVLLYTDDPESGGVAQYNHTILLGLVQAGYRVSCVQSRADNPLIAEQRAWGIAHYWLDYHTGRDFARTLADTALAEKLFREDAPALVLFSDCCPVSNLAAREAALRLGVPYAVVVGFVGAYLANNFSACLPVLAEQYAAARAVVAVSQENLDLLQAHFGLSATAGQVIHYGRPEKFFAPRDAAVRARLRTEIGISDDAIICFTAARLTAVKGHDLQLEALAKLQAGHASSDIHLVWAGEGEQRAAREREIRRRGLTGRVHLLGQRWDVVDWFDAADIFVLTSQLEGMPLAIMEAMAKGLPVIATAVSGIPEELGDTGCLLPDPTQHRSDVAGQLARTLRLWAGNAELRREIGAAGRARADAMFREQLMLERTLECVHTHVTTAGEPAEALVVA